MQGVFKDMFASPRTPTHAATPTSGRHSEGEGTAWEKAAEWSRNILDISRPFSLAGDDKTSGPNTPGKTSHQTQCPGNLGEGESGGREHDIMKATDQVNCKQLSHRLHCLDLPVAA